MTNESMTELLADAVKRVQRVVTIPIEQSYRTHVEHSVFTPSPAAIGHGTAPKQENTPSISSPGDAMPVTASDPGETPDRDSSGSGDSTDGFEIGSDNVEKQSRHGPDPDLDPSESQSRGQHRSRSEKASPGSDPYHGMNVSGAEWTETLRDAKGLPLYAVILFFSFGFALTGIGVTILSALSLAEFAAGFFGTTIGVPPSVTGAADIVTAVISLFAFTLTIGSIGTVLEKRWGLMYQFIGLGVFLLVNVIGYLSGGGASAVFSIVLWSIVIFAYYSGRRFWWSERDENMYLAGLRRLPKNPKEALGILLRP